MSLTVLPMKPVQALAGLSNGRIPAFLLVEVGPKGQLLAPAARAFKALQFQCLGIGLYLTYTWGGCYRDFNGQLNLFLRRYEPVSSVKYWATPRSRRKRWHTARDHGYSSTYWVKKLVNGRYPATAAAPGTSNHGWALAVDTAYDRDPSNGLFNPADAAYIAAHPKWGEFQRLVIEFGFSFELQSEPWHIRYVAGDTVPRKVLDVEHFFAIITGPNPPAHRPPPPLPPAMWDPVNGKFGLWPLNANKPSIRQGSKGDAVKYAQGVFRKERILVHGRQVGVDGDFGPQTKTAAEIFQRAYSLHVDGWIGKQTWAQIDARA